MERYSGDMIVNLTKLPQGPVLGEDIKIKRAFSGEKSAIVDFVRTNFEETWVGETEHALMQSPGHCFIATQGGKLLGFACYDATAKGFFGPIGILPKAQGKQLGVALLIRTMEAMREAGYGYAVIGWVNNAENFYRKAVDAEYIPNGQPENSVYSNLISMK